MPNSCLPYTYIYALDKDNSREDLEVGRSSNLLLFLNAVDYPQVLRECDSILEITARHPWKVTPCSLTTDHSQQQIHRNWGGEILKGTAIRSIIRSIKIF